MPTAEVEARVTRLAVYPIKGLGGQLIQEVEFKTEDLPGTVAGCCGGRSSVFDAAPACGQRQEQNRSRVCVALRAASGRREIETRSLFVEVGRMPTAGNLSFGSLAESG
jgi:hypothetical protein